jgi:hypothetical protein
MGNKSFPIVHQWRTKRALGYTLPEYYLMVPPLQVHGKY